MLPEKKRARRRLVGAIALALAAAVGLPMLLDSEPNKSLAGDIAIQIPSKDKAAPLPAPSVPAAGEAAEQAPAPAPARDKTVALEDSVDKGEEVVQVPPPVKPVAKPEHKPEPKPEHKPEPKSEHKPDSKAEHKLADKADKADKPAKPKPEDKPAKPHDDARAMAILEGKAADKADKADKPAEAGAQKVVLQVAALSSQEKAAELQARLRGAGISSHTEKSGELIKVKVGPLTKDEAEKMRAKLGRIGLSGFATPA
jgi:DedD protein